jgi:hypothetical protein
MLEALIRTKDSDSSSKRLGDVICIKLQEFAGWSKFESSVHKVVEWEDQGLERKMREELEKTGLSPIATTPYMEIDLESNLIKTRSKIYFNLNENRAVPKTPEQLRNELEANKQILENNKNG